MSTTFFTGEKTLVQLAEQLKFEIKEGAGAMLSSGEVQKILGITKLTLLNWVKAGKIRPRKFKFGSRSYYGYQYKEIKRVQDLMLDRQKWSRGKSLLKRVPTRKLPK